MALQADLDINCATGRKHRAGLWALRLYLGRLALLSFDLAELAICMAKALRVILSFFPVSFGTLQPAGKASEV